MVGIKETKELLKFIIEFVEAVDKSLEDGSLGFEDIANLVSAMLAAGPAFTDMELIPAEIANMDESKAIELYNYAQTELNLNSEKVEEIVERCLEIGLKLYQLIQLFKKESKAPASVPEAEAPEAK